MSQRKYPCKWCSDEFKTIYEWFDHVANEISTYNIKVCMMCLRGFPNKEQLLLHVSQHCCSKLIPKSLCIYCGGRYFTGEQCRAHEKNCQCFILQGVDSGENLFSKEESIRLDMIEIKDLLS